MNVDDDRESILPEDPQPNSSSNLSAVPTANTPAGNIDDTTAHDESRPLLLEVQRHEEVVQERDGSESDANSRLSGSQQTVTCRVCEYQIPYENKSMQHVVRCPSCREATPIRAPPAGKKFVRCPCNCLLICKVSSNRIACPRPNCGRVIILKPATSGEASSISAPPGTARVQCTYCDEMFMFNTLSSSIARCPHCIRLSSIGVAYVRSRAFAYFVAALIAFLTLLFVMIGTVGDFSNHIWLLFVYVALFMLLLVFCQRFYYYFRMRVSRILGPV